MKTVMKMIKSIPFYWALTAILFLAFQSRAWAHAFLDHAEPKVGSTAISSPTAIHIWFTQELEPAFCIIEVRNVEGNEMDKKDTHLDGKDKTLLSVSVPSLPDGKYTVTWHVTSVDTHRTQGHFEFTVKSAQK